MMANLDNKKPVLHRDKAKSIINILFRWAPVVLWMTFIFIGSATSNPYRALPWKAAQSIEMPGGNTATAEDPLGIIGHIMEYTILTILACHAVIWKNHLRIWSTAISALFAGVYALSDEFHQLFVPGRAFELRDLGLDALGILVGLLIYGSLWYLYQRRNNRDNHANGESVNSD